MPTAPGWPVVLRSGDVVLRPLRRGDAAAWASARERSQSWLAPWEATVPPGAGTPVRSFHALRRRLAALAGQGACLPFAVAVPDRSGDPAEQAGLVGQLTVSSITRGSAQHASIGYWIDQRMAGRGVMPRALALAIDHCLGPLGLHRIEVAIRPENTKSLRVVEKLGLRCEGLRRSCLHIDGDWRDHLVYAVVASEVDGLVLDRLGPARR